MRARVDAGLCEAHGRCNVICPDVFKLDEWGYAYTDDQPTPDGREGTVHEAADACPERAITVEE